MANSDSGAFVLRNASGAARDLGPACLPREDPRDGGRSRRINTRVAAVAIAIAIVLAAMVAAAGLFSPTKEPVGVQERLRTSASNPPSRASHFVDFGRVVAVSKTTATLQVVSNPLLLEKYSPIAPVLFDNLEKLKADLVRYAAWYPYPEVGVAELEPPDPETKTTSWRFGEDLSEVFSRIWKAVVASGSHRDRHGHLVVTFSTQPAWMFNTTDWSYPPDHNTAVADFEYDKGGWMPSTTKLVADYYSRFAEWLATGSFLDEFNHTVGGGPALGVGEGGLTHWEVFNEPETEHELTVDQYNEMYDAIVRGIRASIDPNRTIRFFGMSLEYHNEWDRWRGFLDPENHAPDVRDAVASGYASFHFYANTPSRTNASSYPEAWPQLDAFLGEVERILEIRDELSPSTMLAVNEAGVIPPEDNSPDAPDLPPVYFRFAAAVYAVLWAELSERGIDVVGSSQYCGCPAIPEWGIPDRMYPGVSMTNWTTGDGNPRYWVLKLLNSHSMGPGDEIVRTTTNLGSNSNSGSGKSSESLYVQARITKGEDPKELLVLVNKSYSSRTLRFTEKSSSADDTSYAVSLVDETTGDGPWKEFVVTSTSPRPYLVLRPFAVAVVEVLDSERSGAGRDDGRSGKNDGGGNRGADATPGSRDHEAVRRGPRRHRLEVSLVEGVGDADPEPARE